MSNTKSTAKLGKPIAQLWNWLFGPPIPSFYIFHSKSTERCYKWELEEDEHVIACVLFTDTNGQIKARPDYPDGPSNVYFARSRLIKDIAKMECLKVVQT